MAFGGCVRKVCWPDGYNRSPEAANFRGFAFCVSRYLVKRAILQLEKEDRNASAPIYLALLC